MITKTVTREEIIEKLLVELEDMEVELPDSPTDELDFVEDCEMDSLDLAEFIARIEQVFRIEIDDEEWKSLNTLGLAVDRICEGCTSPNLTGL